MPLASLTLLAALVLAVAFCIAGVLSISIGRYGIYRRIEQISELLARYTREDLEDELAGKKRQYDEDNFWRRHKRDQIEELRHELAQLSAELRDRDRRNTRTAWLIGAVFCIAGLIGGYLTAQADDGPEAMPVPATTSATPIP